jgi:hypothetical protein
VKNKARTYKWHNLSSGRAVSSLSGSGGFVILGPLPEPSRANRWTRTRPTIGHGQVVAGDVRLVSGLLTIGELAELRAFWGLEPR